MKRSEVTLEVFMVRVGQLKGQVFGHAIPRRVAEAKYSSLERTLHASDWKMSERMIAAEQLTTIEACLM